MIKKIERVLKPFEEWPEWKYIVLLCGIAFILRLIWILVVRTLPIDDAATYDRHAMTLINGMGYVLTDNVTPTAYFPPGYPFVLSSIYSVFGHSIIAAKLLNVILGSATCLITYLIANGLVKNTLAQRLTGLLVAVFPGLIAYSSILYSETAFTFFFMLAILLILKVQAGRHTIIFSIVIGLLTGFACLIRPILMVFPGLLLIYYLYTWRNIRRAVLTSVITAVFMVLAIMPWTIRNYVEMGAFIPISTNSGGNFQIGANPSADGRFPGGNLSIATAKEETAFNSDSLKLGLEWVKDNPVKYISLIPRKVFYFFASDYGGAQHSTKLTENAVPVKAVTALKAVFESWWIIVLGIAGIGIFILNWRRWWFGVPSLLPLIFLYFVAISALTFGDGRFHFPILPLISIVTADTLVALVFKENREKRELTVQE